MSEKPDQPEVSEKTKSDAAQAVADLASSEPISQAAKPARKRGSKARKSGDSAAQEEAAKEADDITEPMPEKTLDVERDEWDRAPGFKRMKTTWEGEAAAHMQRVLSVVNRVVMETFPEVYAVMSDLYDVVREVEVDEATGEVRTDALGLPVWKRHPITNAYIEDWTLLTTRQKEDFLFRITTQLFEWEQRAGDLWTEAMFAKGVFTEKFAIEFDAPTHGTIEDRTARGNKQAAEDRYFALLQAATSRKADALIRSMTNLMLRLKDTLGQ